MQERTAELTAKNIALEVASTTDVLTGIKNRMKLDELLHYEINIAKRYKRDFCIILIDLDHFKDINDTFGHIAGDKALIGFAQCIGDNIRTSDSLGRWGGEEFLIICPATNIDNTMELAEKLRTTVEASSFPAVGKLTASFGVACYKYGDNINSIIKRADEALYRAKIARNTCCTCFYDDAKCEKMTYPYFLINYDKSVSKNSKTRGRPFVDIPE